MKKLIYLVLLCLVLLPLVSASLGEFKQNECVNIKTILNTSAVTISSLSYPNYTTALDITNMEKRGLTFNYTFCNTSTYGNYVYDYNDTEGNVYENDFKIGYTLSLSIAVFSIFILIILITFLYFSVKGIFKAEEGGWQIFYICISYIVLFSTFFLLWVFSDNYLYDIPILESIFWIIWLILSILFFPFLILISGYILKKQGEALAEGGYLKQGYTREEAKEMAKKKR